ncbi:hypothetical protein [Haemophilus haemolyticus]|nr:hypothetical protein [Haemophilus haemolyticus]
MSSETIFRRHFSSKVRSDFEIFLLKTSIIWTLMLFPVMKNCPAAT